MTTSQRGPVLLCLASAVLWGFWWWPVRWLEGMGLEGGFAGLAMTLGALPGLVLAAMVMRGGWPDGRAMLGAVAVGAAVTLYGGALTQTDVVRAVLLFYLAPGWSIAIECLFLGRRWTARAGVAIVLSLLGMLVILRGDISLAGWGAGDAMALGSGLAWSIGAALIFTARAGGAARLALLAALVAVVIGGVLALTGDAPAPGVEAMRAASGAVLGSGLLFLAPILLVTLWAARALPPATLSFLLTAEIISGVASSALLLDEPFGVVEAAGALLVTLGALVEVAPSVKRRDPVA